MKMEFLAEGSADRPLIRLYDFDVVGARRLREAFRSLADGTRRTIPLHEEWWIEPVDECRLTLRLGVRNLGVVQRVSTSFDCVLTKDAWRDGASLTDPFCEAELTRSDTWLDQNGEIALLLSPSGLW